MFDHRVPLRSCAVIVIVAVVAVGAACGSSDGSQFGPDTSTQSQTGSDSGTGPGGNEDGGHGGFGSDDGGGSTSNLEVCDGIDNDGDGIIDNVDVGGDGVCDCLKIATLGFPGTVGEGDVFSSWLNGKSTAGAVALEAKTLTPELLEGFDVIVAQDVREGSQIGKGKGIGRAYAKAEVDTLEAWIKAGGGFMTLTGYGDTNEMTNSNRLLAPFGMKYGPDAILKKNGSVTVPIAHWTTSHPLAADITKVGVDNGHPVYGGDLIAWEPQPGKYDVGRATSAEKGHVFVWGDEWITFNSEWKNVADYQVERFWLNTLKWLSPANQCQVALPPVR